MGLEVEHLTKRYRDIIAVSDMSFSLDKGVYGLLGPNGAGKSTLMKMLTLQLSPTEGRILWEGTDIARQKQAYLGVLGYMPQQQNMYPNYTVEEFLFYMAALHGMDAKTTREKVGWLLEKLGLSNKRRTRIKALSGGMKQRLLLLQAVMHEPGLLILDEPTAGLDPQQRVAVRNLVTELAVDSTVLLATHVVQDVELISKETLLLKDGILIAKGNHQELCGRLAGKVFEINISKEQLHRYLGGCLVSSIRENLLGGYVVRVIADAPPAGADCHEAEATLEDVSRYYFGREEEC